MPIPKRLPKYAGQSRPSGVSELEPKRFHRFAPADLKARTFGWLVMLRAEPGLFHPDTVMVALPDGREIPDLQGIRWTRKVPTGVAIKTQYLTWPNGPGEAPVAVDQIEMLIEDRLQPPKGLQLLAHELHEDVSEGPPPDRRRR